MSGIIPSHTVLSRFRATRASADPTVRRPMPASLPLETRGLRTNPDNASEEMRPTARDRDYSV
jgi:hypothetical protein